MEAADGAWIVDDATVVENRSKADGSAVLRCELCGKAPGKDSQQKKGLKRVLV